MKSPFISVWFVALVLSLAAIVAPAAEKVERVVVWDLAALSKVPAIHETTESPAPAGMRGFFYEGADYKGKPTWVFAYYKAPEGKAPEGGWPAVVCAHGGGGTAYPDWIKEWNRRGYAAIAMDLEGHLPGGNAHGIKGKFPVGRAHPNAGPSRIDYFGDRALPDKEQWFYHAVADVIRAHSLLASFPEINPRKIGLTGISWGGTVVSTVAGVDARFAFVIPVYGGGFIHESDNPGLSQWFPPTNMTPEQFRDYKTKWDPSAHLPYAMMPMLWASALDDPVFQVDIFAKSAKAAGGPSTLCVRTWMIHGHGYGWEEPWEIYAFADSIVKGGVALVSVGRPETDAKSGLVRAKFTGDLKHASVHYTTSGGKWKSRKWGKLDCTAVEGELTARQRLPEGTRAYMVFAWDKRDNLVNSELVVVKP